MLWRFLSVFICVLYFFIFSSFVVEIIYYFSIRKKKKTIGIFQLEYLKIGDIIVRGNLIKWTMITPKNYDTKLESKSFAIRYYSCKFNYYSGSETCNSNSRDPPHPVQLAKFFIDYHTKESFKPSLPVTILISSSCKTFKPQRCYLTGESNQIIWSILSSSDLLNISMTLEMVIEVSKGKLKKNTSCLLSNKVAFFAIGNISYC